MAGTIICPEVMICTLYTPINLTWLRKVRVHTHTHTHTLTELLQTYNNVMQDREISQLHVGCKHDMKATHKHTHFGYI